MSVCVCDRYIQTHNSYLMRGKIENFEISCWSSMCAILSCMLHLPLDIPKISL